MSVLDVTQHQREIRDHCKGIFTQFKERSDISSVRVILYYTNNIAGIRVIPNTLLSALLLHVAKQLIGSMVLKIVAGYNVVTNSNDLVCRVGKESLSWLYIQPG